METVNILYFGKHQEILETVVRLINAREKWSGEGTSELAAAKEYINTSAFHIVLLGCGIEEQEEHQLREFISTSHPGIRVIQHYGGGSGLLFNEVMEALSGNNVSY